MLFVDLIGFTSVAERLDPEDLRRLQVAYFATASQLIRQYGGIVEKYIGDAVMAVFGVPVETEHDAYRAVRAGLDLQRDLDDQPLAGRYRMRTRVGIATGEALVDLGAARQAGEALVSGDVVATAMRLQQHAPAGGVLVSTMTHRATQETIRYEEQPLEMRLAGRSAPIEVWLAQEPATQRSGLDHEATPFVGRLHELDLLTTALSRCVREREARLVSVVGEHGVGKSRLVRELIRRLKAGGDATVRWRSGRCLPYGQGAPFAALGEIIKTHADIHDTDKPAPARQQLAAALGELVPATDVERLTNLVGPLVGLPGLGAQDPAEAESAWRDVLVALARQATTALVVEDLQFAEPTLLRFLARLVDAATEVPLLVVCTYRPELLQERPIWAAALPGTLTVTLGPLRDAEFASLVHALLDRHGLPEALGERLATITAGNPMYAVEYVRMLAERSVSDDLDVVDSAAELAIPETVHGVVANRIDLLDRAERTVLHAAAVLGDSVWPGALAAMLDPGVDVTSALRGLERRDMLVPNASSTMADEPELSFRHLLLRDVAYRRLPRATRAMLHRRAASWLELVRTDGRHDLASAVARHRVSALEFAQILGEDTHEDALAARRALTAAAHAAFAVHAVEPALSSIDQALNVWPREEDQDERRDAQLLRSLLAFLADSDTFYRDGGAKEVAALADAMRDAGDRSGEARAETLLGQAEWMRAERQRAYEHLGRAVALFAELPESAAKAEAYSALARLHIVEYRAEPAITAARTARSIAEHLGLADAAAHALITEAAARYLTGDPAGLAETQRAVELCRAQRLPALARAAHNLATMLQEEGELARAAESEAEGSAARGAQVTMLISHSEDAERAYFTGDWVDLLRAADEYLDGEDAETTEWDLQLRARRAWIRVLCGESPGGDVDRCLDFARQSGFSRLRFSACAHGALCRRLAGDAPGMLDLLDELATLHRAEPAAFTLEWLSAAAHAAAFDSGPHAAALLAEVTAGALRRTRWVAAAELLVAGAVASGQDEHAGAADRFAAAVRAYDEIGGASDAVLAAAWTARAHQLADNPTGAGPYAARVRDFARRNHAPAFAALVG